jgi:transcriptional regulator GlxA family with amidase domain
MRYVRSRTTPSGIRPRDSAAVDRAKSTSGARRIVFLAVPPIEELDLIGPLEVFAGVNRVLREPKPAYKIEVFSGQNRSVIRGECGVSLLAQGYYRRLHGDVDTLIVVGGPSVRAFRDNALALWLRKMASRVRRLGSVCVGAFVLAEAGLLNGKRATTHWAFAKELAERYPSVTVDSRPIWVQDGKLYTSAGVTTGIDLALRLVEEDLGSAVSLEVARGLVLFLRRPGGQAQFSVSLSAQACEHKVLHELQVWIADNLPEVLTIEALAARAAMSPRNFARTFVRGLHVTPARYVEQLRLEAARRQLETTNRSLDEIAAASGFGNAEVMRRAFLRCLQTTPTSYRSHFAAQV